MSPLFSFELWSSKHMTSWLQVAGFLDANLSILKVYAGGLYTGSQLISSSSSYFLQRNIQPCLDFSVAAKGYPILPPICAILWVRGDCPLHHGVNPRFQNTFYFSKWHGRHRRRPCLRLPLIHSLVETKIDIITDLHIKLDHRAWMMM